MGEKNIESKIIKTEKTPSKNFFKRFNRALFVLVYHFNFSRLKFPNLIPNDFSDHIKHKWFTQHYFR